MNKEWYGWISCWGILGTAVIVVFLLMSSCVDKEIQNNTKLKSECIAKGGSVVASNGAFQCLFPR